MHRARRFTLLIVGLLNLVAACSFGAETPVTLVARTQHIPVHPAPGDTRVPFRFVGGSTGRVIARDPATGWLQVQGKRVGGGMGTGWIVERYIVSNPGQPGRETLMAPPRLDWCPSKGSPDPHPSGRLRIASWNLHNLHARDGRSTFIGRNPSVVRSAPDYDRIRCYIRMFDPDILAVQEVDGAKALRRVVDTDVYDVAVSTRPQPPNMGGKQNTGFAFKRGLDIRRRTDVRSLDVRRGSLRYGSRIDVTIGQNTYLIMNVHLKSGCFDDESTAAACGALHEQVKMLERWIDEAAAGPHPFVVLGDFNRRFNRPADQLWRELDDGNPTGLALTAVTREKPTTCRDNEFPEYVDHIVLDQRALRDTDVASFRQVTYRREDRSVWHHLSDHCPIVVDMWPPR